MWTEGKPSAIRLLSLDASLARRRENSGEACGKGTKASLSMNKWYWFSSMSDSWRAMSGTPLTGPEQGDAANDGL